MNPFRRFIDFLSYPSHSRTIGLLAFLVVLLAVPLTVNIAQKQQELRQHAGGSCDTVGQQQKIPCSKSCPDGSTVQGVSVAECQSNFQWFNDGTCYATCPGTSTPVPSTTPTPTPTSTAPPAATICPAPAGTVPSTPHSGNTEDWGGSCPGPAFANQATWLGGTSCGCTVARCETYSNGPLCWVNNGQTYNDPAGCKAKGAAIPDSCFTTGAACDASKGFIASCKFGTDPSTKDNPVACTQANGQLGKSVMECQSNNCFYDSYYDSSPNKAPKTQWCYPNGNGTQISFTIGLDGIGSTGDQKNPNPQPISNQSRGSNQNPRRTTRTFFYQVFDAAGTTEQANGQGSIAFDSSSGKYKASATLNKTLADGTYLLKVRVQGHLAKIVGSVAVTGGIANVPNTNLVNGDTDADNRLSIIDYNTILGCLFKPATGSCSVADLDDNGTIDQFDYNLFVREFAVVQQGD